MPKPTLLAIDDDTSVLEAVVQDLRRNYGQNYRIIRAASGSCAVARIALPSLVNCTK